MDSVLRGRVLTLKTDKAKDLVAVLANRMAQANLEFRFDTNRKQYSPKVRFLMFIERLTGWRISDYRNYTLRPS